MYTHTLHNYALTIFLPILSQTKPQMKPPIKKPTNTNCKTKRSNDIMTSLIPILEVIVSEVSTVQVFKLTSNP